jgi:hypothetical protein
VLSYCSCGSTSGSDLWLSTVSWCKLEASECTLTVVAESFDIPFLTNDIQTEVVLDRMEVMGTLELTAMHPAGKEGKGKLVKILECQLVRGRRWSGRQQLVEEGNLASEQGFGDRELFVGNTSTKNGDWNVFRCRSLAAWVVGMDGGDEHSGQTS